ncbi:MAG: hypothetical protein BRC58_04005 [Cyanobacteria bacterium QS_8_64_29]|nr:MAG: hypothetical protein BRC58_04005 [Cyanobacteria bacterium QS_8_64_29]
MPYTEEEGGRKNNFASQPRMYAAQPPSGAQKRNYAIMGGLFLLLVGGLVYVTMVVSESSAGAG